MITVPYWLDVVLAGVVVLCALACLVRPSAWLALTTFVASAVWWPANNRVLEGPTLVYVTAHHGVTVSDLLGVVGAVAALSALLRLQTTRPQRWILIVVAGLILLAGVLAAGLSGG